MWRAIRRRFLLLVLGVAGAAVVTPAQAADLSVAPPEELLRVYGQLRQLAIGDQSAVTENVVWKRAAATFTFREGRLFFAAPIEGRVLGAVFEGQGTVVLNPPSPLDQRQISRFTKGSLLQDQFHQAVFFFTDDSWSELQKVVKIQGGGASAVGDSLSAAQRKYAESFNDWWENEAKGNFQMRNLAARMLADLTDPSSRGFFLADFKGDRSGDLLYHVSWNRDPLLLPDFAKGEEVMLLHYNRGNYFEWWSGFHLAEEYARTPQPDHRTLLAHCRQARIDAEVAKDNRLSATAGLEFEVPGGAARLLPLNLRGVLRISDIQDAEGKKVAFIQEDRKLDNDPWLILPAPAKVGQVYKIRIAYAEDSTRESRIIRQRGSGLYYVTARESWFPSFGAFDDRTQYSLRLRSPKKFTLVATGRAAKSEKDKDVLQSEWESEIPYSVVGFNYGNFADKSQSDPNLTVIAYGGKEAPDELKELSSAIATADLARGVGHRDSASRLGSMQGGFNTIGMLQYAAGLSFQALKFFEYLFGPLPFKRVSVTEQPVRGYGQSWPTLIFLPYDSLLDATTRNSLGLQDFGEAREFYNLVAVHEMAHQWWGHLVGWKTYHDQWLSEGIAEFASALYLRQFEPKKWNSFWDLKRRWLLSKNRAGQRPVDVGPLWLNVQLNEHEEPRNSMYLTYYKGAYVMEMLRAIMENPSDRKPDLRFINMLHDFVTTYAGKNASTEDFRRIVENHMGEPMDWFFNEWVYGAETPTYDFKYQLKPGAGGGTTLQASLTQSEVSDSFQMRVPLYAYVKGQLWRLPLIEIRGSNTVSGELPLPFRPDKVTLDENRSILCTIRQ
jgi:hypothetical protein